ncbi:MAG: hypothetical protein LBQ79_09925 [Deltaproteobacteria bacterium]|jgi:hypothetical protein|nr:hypothetical protein [Deltaproteobacteria bacterium]
MDLFQNPFHILGVGPRSTREEILDAAEGASLSGDTDRAAEASAALANPRRRLSAEVFFLPGIDGRSAAGILAGLKGRVKGMQPCRGVTPVAAVNLTAAALTRLEGTGAQGTAYGISLLSQAFESADAREVMDAVNADRRVARVAAVPSVTDVEEELDRLRLYCRDVVRAALDRLPSRALVEAASQAVRSETDNAAKPPPVLVRDMMEIYDLESRAFFDREQATVGALTAAMRRAASKDSSLGRKALAVADDLEKVLMNWQSVAAPLLTFLKSTGVTHRPSLAVALEVRDAAVEIHNGGADPALAKRVTSILAAAFADVADVSEAVAGDARMLWGR